MSEIEITSLILLLEGIQFACSPSNTSSKKNHFVKITKSLIAFSMISLPYKLTCCEKEHHYLIQTSLWKKKIPLPSEVVRKSKVQHIQEIPPDVKSSRC